MSSIDLKEGCSWHVHQLLNAFNTQSILARAGSSLTSPVYHVFKRRGICRVETFKAVADVLIEIRKEMDQAIEELQATVKSQEKN